MAPITQAQLDNWFTYHSDPDDVPKYVAIRDAGKAMARLIIDSCPPCADTTAAIRKLREAIMTANAAIACKGA